MQPEDPSGLTPYQPRAIDTSIQRFSGRDILIPSPPHSPLADYWRILRKRKWVILSAAIIVPTVVAIISLRMTPTYEAAARIAINHEESGGLRVNEREAPDYAFDYNVELDTQARILQSDTLALMVIDTLHLDKDARYGSVRTSSAKRENPRDPAVLRRFRKELSVNKIQRTRMVEIRYVSPDAKLAAQIVNTLGNVYVENNFKTRYESTAQASEWLQNQLNDLQIRVEQSQEALVKFQRENGIIGIDEKQNVTFSKLDDLNKEVTSAEADRIQKQAAYDLTRNGNLDAIPELSNNVLMSDLRRQESDLKRQLAEAKTQFGPSYPKVQQLSNQLVQMQTAIKGEIDRVASRKRSEYQAAVQRERMLRSSFAAQAQAVNDLNERAVDYYKLKREADSNRQLYEGLLAKLKEAAVTSGLRSSNVRIVDPARVPQEPTKPDIPRNIGLGLLLGIVGGMALAFVLEELDNTVRTPDEIATISRLPVLGMVPASPLLDASAIPAGKKSVSLRARPMAPAAVGFVAHTRPRSEISEAYRALRTSILLSATGQVPKVLLMTSALPREGKTTTSLNTAIVLAQKGGKVLLVDADMRRPNLHQTLSVRSGGGLSSLLSGNQKFEEVVSASGILPNLFVLPAGPPPPHPAELLGSSLMQSCLERWRSEYDHIVIDTPPVLSVTDAVLLSVQADAVVLVVRCAHTTRAALRRSRELLMQVNARVMGVVLNGIDMHSPESYLYYYGGRHSSHYYDESVRDEVPRV